MLIVHHLEKVALTAHSLVAGRVGHTLRAEALQAGPENQIGPRRFDGHPPAGQIAGHHRWQANGGGVRRDS